MRKLPNHKDQKEGFVRDKGRGIIKKKGVKKGEMGVLVMRQDLTETYKKREKKET